MKPSWRHNLPFEVVEGDIGAHALAHGPWLAVVSSDDSYLSHSDGASLAIWNASGLSEEIPFSLPRPLGSLVSTGPGKLKASTIFHAVTLDVDTRARLDRALHADLYTELADRLQILWTLESRSRRVLLPLIGGSDGGPTETEISDRIAMLAARLGEVFDVHLAIVVPHGARRIHDRICTAYGIVDVPIDLDSYLGAPPGPHIERLTRCFSALELLLAMMPGSSVSPARRSLGGLWTGTQALLERYPQDRVPWSALQFMPAVIEFRNSITHGSEPALPARVAANMAETSLRALLKVVESGVLSCVNPQAARTALQRQADRPGDEMRRLLRLRFRQTTDSLQALTRSKLELERLMGELRSSEDMANEARAELAQFASPNDRTRSRSSPVRRLAALLSELPEEDRAHLREKLDAMDYRGDESKRLIEYCTREDPAQILDDLGTLRLRALLTTRFGSKVRITDPMPVLRDHLLRELGFRTDAQLFGLHSALEELEEHRKAIPIADSNSIHGMVVRSSGKFERTIRDLLRFMCLYLFREGPENHFKRHLNGAARRDFGKATLGTLLLCLELLAKEIEDRAGSKETHRDRELPLLELQGPLSATRLAPAGVQGLSNLRNAFAHFEKEHGEQHAREKAREFFDGAISVLNHWMSACPPIYPTVIVVEEIRLDRWNRRTVVTRSDAGRKEVLICDNDLKPGDVYFMYPLSNPMRVDPILIRFEPDAVVP